MERAKSLEKTLLLGKSEGKRRRRQQRFRWLDSITNSWSLLKLMSIDLVMPSDHLIFCRSLLLLPSIFPSIRVFSNESVLHITWPKYWSFSISPSSEYSGLFPLGLTGLISLQSIKKAEGLRIYVFELWYWRRLLRVPCTARRSNQSILKINPGISLEGLMLKLKLQYFGHLT